MKLSISNDWTRASSCRNSDNNMRSVIGSGRHLLIRIKVASRGAGIIITTEKLFVVSSPSFVSQISYWLLIVIRDNCGVSQMVSSPRHNKHCLS